MTPQTSFGVVCAAVRLRSPDTASAERWEVVVDVAVAPPGAVGKGRLGLTHRAARAVLTGARPPVAPPRARVGSRLVASDARTAAGTLRHVANVTITPRCATANGTGRRAGVAPGLRGRQPHETDAVLFIID